MKTILFFYRDLGNGGVQKNMLRLAEGLVQRGWKIDFLIARTENMEFAVPEGVLVHRAASANPWQLVWALARMIDRDKPDAIYTAMPNYNCAALVARMLARHKPKIIISERSDTRAERRQGRFDWYGLSLRLAPWLYTRADRILAVSEETADSLAAASGIARDRIVVLHNPVVSEALEKAAAQPLHHEWVEGPYRLLVAVGRLAPQKDFATLLRAFALLHRKRDATRLVIIGGGEERTQLEALAAELDVDQAVDFIGFDANPYRWMARADVFVLTSLWEGLPTVIIEALACGATIVATDSPSGPAQIIGRDGTLGYLAPIGDAQAIAEKLDYALDHKLDPDALRAASRQYSSGNSVAQFEEILLDLLPKYKN
jgi:glycosyltransferase involved in cell wall biosynthesis